MKVLIFGSPGTIGRQLVAQALANGDDVTAFARDPAKLDAANAALAIARGDVLDPASVARAMPGHDAVVIALGAGARGEVRTTGTQNIIASMQANNVSRLVCLSSLGVGDSRANLNFVWKYLMFGLLLRRAYADHVTQEEAVKASGLDWIIVRPGAYADGDITGQYKHGFPPTEKDIKLKISRADVADFMMKQLTGNTYLRQSPGLSY